ncbi:g12530 [Coccomyxa viridis]|uniref:G12530 protein n=1 Tax=Coccomyxa viridis TaxID=1274662 RepID=A0ABP1GHK9_9CHLO
MGLLSILKKEKQKRRELRLLFVGLDNAGKTTIVKKIAGLDISQVSPTLGFQIHSLQFRGIRLNIWDIGGQATLRPYWQNYYERTGALLWVVDSSDVGRLEICRDELHGLLKEEKLVGATLLILANKQDLQGALPASEIKKVLELDSCGRRHWRILGCSAVTGSGLLESFDWLLSDVQGRIQLL